MQPISRPPVAAVSETTIMLIYMLATAMTVLMLIATAFGMHQEAQRVRLERSKHRYDGFGAFRRQ